MYMNPIYGIFDQDVIQEEFDRQMHHNDQMRKSFDCARKLDDFLKSMEEIEPRYQQIAFEQCCLVIGKHMSERRWQ